MADKVVVITGATMPNGLGFVCAKTVAMKGAKVILLNRLSERASAAVNLLKSEVPGADVSTIECDLSSFTSVRSACEALTKQVKDTGIDVLCNNAGVMALADEATVDGFDVQMQTNHLSHFLLCKELFPLLEKAAAVHGEARIVHHSSGARHMGGVLQAKYLGKNGGNLGGNSASMFCGGARWIRYGQSKLANVM
jgi:NAD(P)-dependent dehydrogenase (short-subunit alcohol dehydrogenase family)